jgi:hypothetical protein
MNNNTPHAGPFPLRITKNDDHFVIVTNHETHYAKTFDPSAARLIAAAPGLLSALEEMMAVFQDHEQYDEDSAEVIQSAREAIRKAKGEA